MSHEGQYLAATTTDGRVNVWDLLSNDRAKIREYTTKGSLGLCIDLVSGKLFQLKLIIDQSASPAMATSLPAVTKMALSTCSTTPQTAWRIPCKVRGKPEVQGGADMKLGLIKPVRTVKFSPASKILAAAGDSEVIMLYDVASGEQIATLSGHKSWIASLDWSRTGEYLLSGYVLLNRHLAAIRRSSLIIHHVVLLMERSRSGQSKLGHALLR